MIYALAPPPALHTLPAGYQLRAGLRVATVLPDIDFETYSEAGFVYNDGERKWIKTAKSSNGRGGLPAVGVVVYAQHPSTEILCLAYDLKDGRGRRRWRPGMPAPLDLFAHVLAGGLVEAFNSAFEWWVWNLVGLRYGFPPLSLPQVRCAQAKGRAWSMPPSLDGVAEVLGVQGKAAEGSALIKALSVPRNPTKKDPRLRLTRDTEPAMFARFDDYNEQDIVVEAEVSSRVPDLSPVEQEYWLLDREINTRGVHIDVEGVENCIALIEVCHERYNRELAALTGGVVTKGSEVQKLTGWLAGKSVYMDGLDEDTVDAKLKELRKSAPVAMAPAIRALEIRQAVGSASVKKVYAMRNQVSRQHRLHELFTFHGARTGRPTGNGPQPTNLPNSGPACRQCVHCARWFPLASLTCTNCLWVCPPPAKTDVTEWNIDAAEDALRDIATRSLDLVEMRWGDAMHVLSGCLRPLFTAAPGHDLICSDYSAIEAVVNAALSGEQWRLDVFFGHGKIYEASAAAMFNLPVETLLQHVKDTGQHHPLRKKGKVAELALGYLGWIGALRAMGYDGTDAEATELIIAWRKASPSIVFLGGGQKAHPAMAAFHRYAVQKGGVDLATDPVFASAWAQAADARPWDCTEPYLYGLEGTLVAALQQPGVTLPVYRLDGTPSGLSWVYQGDVLYMVLPDETTIAYHRPRLGQPEKEWRGQSIRFEGYNTNQKTGPVGWISMWTYAGKLLENACQAVANRILRYGQVNLRAAGYPLVLHVYDENVAEVPTGFGSVEHFEAEMSRMPGWAVTRDGRPWPIKAKGGWRGTRYRK